MTKLSENGWTEKDLRRKIDLDESNLEYHENEAERYRARLKSLRQELGTLPVKESAV